MESTLKNAIAKAKRDILNGNSKESIIDNISYDYYLRADEKQQLIKSIDKWLNKIFEEIQQEINNL